MEGAGGAKQLSGAVAGAAVGAGGDAASSAVGMSIKDRPVSRTIYPQDGERERER